jgi:excisionase family DNA binding protein
MAAGPKPKELFTASEVARFCQVDLKTIHNWSDRGEIRHFRTPGRHLRFRRADVLDFLRKYGYPIPDALAAGRPTIVALSSDGSANNAAKRALSKQFDVTTSGDVLDTLIGCGCQKPDVVVVDTELGEVDAIAVIRSLGGNDATRSVRIVLYASNADDRRRAALDAGASAVVEKGDTGKLRETLEALLGLGR